MFGTGVGYGYGCWVRVLGAGVGYGYGCWVLLGTVTGIGLGYTVVGCGYGCWVYVWVPAPYPCTVPMYRATVPMYGIHLPYHRTHRTHEPYPPYPPYVSIRTQLAADLASDFLISLKFINNLLNNIIFPHIFV